MADADTKKLNGLLRGISAGDIPTVANPVRFSATAVEYRYAPSRLGEHTGEILSGELGYSDKEIEALCLAGAI
jgi:glutaryl-CoA transferase